MDRIARRQRRAVWESQRWTSGQRQVQRSPVPRLVDGCFDGSLAVDAEGDGRTERAPGNRIRPDHVDAEPGEVARTPDRRDCAPGRPDVRLDARARRLPSAASVEDLTGEAHDRPDAAVGGGDREDGEEPCRGSMPGPSRRLAAEDDLVLHEGPEKDLRARRAASSRLGLREHGDLVPPGPHPRQRVLTRRDETVPLDDRTEVGRVERHTVKGGAAPDDDPIVGTPGDRRRSRIAGDGAPNAAVTVTAATSNGFNHLIAA